MYNNYIKYNCNTNVSGPFLHRDNVYTTTVLLNNIILMKKVSYDCCIEIIANDLNPNIIQFTYFSQLFCNIF